MIDLQLSITWPDTRVPGRYVYRNTAHGDEFYTVVAGSRAGADEALRLRMRRPEHWALVEALAFIPPSLRKEEGPLIADGQGVRPIATPRGVPFLPHRPGCQCAQCRAHETGPESL